MDWNKNLKLLKSIQTELIFLEKINILEFKLNETHNLQITVISVQIHCMTHSSWEVLFFTLYTHDLTVYKDFRIPGFDT